MISSSSLFKFYVDLNLGNLAFPKAISDASSYSPMLGSGSLPHKGFMKLNIDGSWKSPDIAYGDSFICRGNDGWFTRLSNKFLASTPLAAELITLRVGLELAKELNVTKLEVKMDSQALHIMLGE